jgi:hypothetical protein
VGELDLRNSFATVVHDAPVGALDLRNSFATVVHDAPVGALDLRNSFATVAHDATFVFNVSDIVGTVGTPATFDATTQGLPVADYAHEWSWVSVPGGSSYVNHSIPFPVGGVNTYLDMTSNQGLWHFEGDADDSSGNSRNGTVTGASLVAGRVGAQAYQFGVTDNINFGAASNFISANFSISLWLKGDTAWVPAIWDSIAGASNGFSWSQGFGIFWQDATTIRCFVGSYGGNYADITVTSANWNHIVMTWDGANIAAYLNGNLVSTTAHSAALTGLSNDFFASWMGTHGDGEQTIDELSIWDRDLSQSEVYDIYFIQSGSAASASSGQLNLDDEFTFNPDVVGTYAMNLKFYAYDSGVTENGDVDAVISSGGGSVITGSTPTVKLIDMDSTGYVLNTYNIQNLSVQRARASEQVPFKLGGKGIQSLRLRLNTEFTGSS